MAEPFEPGTLLPDDLPNGMTWSVAGRRRAAQIPSSHLRYPRCAASLRPRVQGALPRRGTMLTTYINLGFKTWARHAEASTTSRPRDVAGLRASTGFL